MKQKLNQCVSFCSNTPFIFAAGKNRFNICGENKGETMNYKTANDKELWECCQSQSDERAFDELFCRYFKRMFHLSTYYVKDSMQAEELVMDCFFKLWDRRERVNIDGKFENYLSRCVHNAVISSFEKQIPFMVGLEQVENTFQTEHSTDSYLLMDDVLKIYNKALDKLSPRRREVFVLSRHENLSGVEIAQKMDITESAVKNYMTAALEGLRVNMKECISVLLLLFSSIF